MLICETGLLVAGEAGVYLDDCIKRGVTLRKTLRLLSLLALTSPDRTNRSGTPSLRRYIQAIIDVRLLLCVCVCVCVCMYVREEREERREERGERREGMVSHKPWHSYRGL